MHCATCTVSRTVGLQLCLDQHHTPSSCIELAAVIDPALTYCCCCCCTQPCGKCIPKPHNYKCDADYCTRTIKKKYKGGYKGDFAEDDLYKDDDGDKDKYLTKEEYSQQQYSGNSQYGQHQEQQYGQGSYENGQYKQQQGEEYSKEQSQPEFVERSVQQPLKQSAREQQQHKQHDGKHEKHDKDHKEHKERKDHNKVEKQEKQQAQPEKPSGFKWPFPKIG